MAKRWYIIHAYSNFENKVADSIREQAKHRHLDYLFEQIIVPTEKLVDVRHGQKHATERKFFPGYVLAKMELTDEAYHLIRNTPKVTGFLGCHEKPIPISDAEAAHILHQIQEGIERPKPLVYFRSGRAGPRVGRPILLLQRDHRRGRRFSITAQGCRLDLWRFDAG
jgi:transcription termination/antitermination protein NusG